MTPGADTLWAALPLPTLLISPAGAICAANPAAEAFLNRSERSLDGTAFSDSLSSDAQLKAAFRRVGSGGGALTVGDIEIDILGGDTVRCRGELSPMGANGDVQGNILLILLPAGATRGKGHGAFSNSAQSAIGMAEMLSHEIKNPLTGISGAAQLLSMSLGDDDRELTEMIVSETRRVLKLLEQVEQFGNLPSPGKRPLNLHDVLDRARQSALLGFASDVPITEDYDPSLPEALGNPDQLIQVFLNLLKNAAEALNCTEGGYIRIRSHYESGPRIRDMRGRMRPVPLRVEIMDNGPGLPPEIANAVFDPFVSGRENGTGLGLALASKIVAGHGGGIGVRSHPGRTVFTVSLPEAPRPAGRNRWTEPY